MQQQQEGRDPHQEQHDERLQGHQGRRRGPQAPEPVRVCATHRHDLPDEQRDARQHSQGGHHDREHDEHAANAVRGRVTDGVADPVPEQQAQQRADQGDPRPEGDQVADDPVDEV